ncbi:MAG: BglII/BstYI family type II restriction endonuclease [Roseiarcus sp.]
MQFGNMARWYSDIFKFQAAYSQSLIQCGLCVVPMGEMARTIDSNVAHYERAVRELPSANLSITLPILLIGLERDDATPIADVSDSRFPDLKEILKHENRWRIINGYMNGQPMNAIGADSEVGPVPIDAAEAHKEDGAPSSDWTTPQPQHRVARASASMGAPERPQKFRPWSKPFSRQRSIRPTTISRRSGTIFRAPTCGRSRPRRAIGFSITNHDARTARKRVAAVVRPISPQRA